MRNTLRNGGLLAATLGLVTVGAAQTPKAGPPASAPAPAQVNNNAVAALVNGQAVSEMAVLRAIKRVPPADQAKARAEVLDYLIDNILVEQYLVAQKVTVTPAEINARIGEIQAEMTKHKQDFAKMMQELNLSEAEMRSQVEADLRWDKFAAAQANDQALSAMFKNSTEMFDGSMVRARHILITPADSKQVDAVRATLAGIKKEVLAAGDQALAQLPAGADPLAREQARTKAIEAKFAEKATAHSACPSKSQGGDISWFPRAASMVEPFAKAAFALKPYEISEPVATPFGFHLILVTGRKPGQPVTFEKVKDEVREQYCSQLREGLVAQLRRNAKVTVTPK